MKQLINIRSVVVQTLEVDWDKRKIDILHTGKYVKGKDIINYDKEDVLRQRLNMTESGKRFSSIAVGARSIIAKVLIPDENITVSINNELNYSVIGKVHHSQTGRIDGVSRLFFNDRYKDYIQNGVFDIEYNIKERKLNLIPVVNS